MNRMVVSPLGEFLTLLERRIRWNEIDTRKIFFLTGIYEIGGTSECSKRVWGKANRLRRLALRSRSRGCSASLQLVGANKLGQLEDNLAAASLTLSPDESSRLDEMTKPDAIYPNGFNTNIFDQQAKKALEG
jgi:hypothetical protein